MKKQIFFTRFFVLILFISLAGCWQSPTPAPVTSESTSGLVQAVSSPVGESTASATSDWDATLDPDDCKPVGAAAEPTYKNPELCIEDRVDDLLARMTLAEKIGQMTQVENNSIRPNDITTKFICSVLSGGGYPTPNNPPKWAEMVGDYQEYALQTPLQIPLIYGVDAIHGHGNVSGSGNITEGTTILETIEHTISENAIVEFDKYTKFDQITDNNGNPTIALATVSILTVPAQLIGWAVHLLQTNYRTGRKLCVTDTLMTKTANT